MEELLTLLSEVKSDVDFENCTSLVEGGLLDSLDIVEIIDAIETNFGVSIPPEEIDPDNFQSAQTIWEMIERSKE